MAQNHVAFDLAVGTSRTCLNWKNTKTSWPDLVERLRNQVIHRNESRAIYQTATAEEKEKIKDVGGYVGGIVRGGRRLKGSVPVRQIITLDADSATPESFDAFRKAFPGVAFVCSSSISHTPDRPKFRFLIPLARPVDVAEYQAVSRWLCDRVGMDIFDPTTFQPERFMYWPTVLSDGTLFFEEQVGDYLNPDKVLSKFADWRDASSWPVHPKETIKRDRGMKQADPTKKTGIVGVFCREFTIQAAIEKFLPEVYSGGPDRFTFVGGSSVNGLVIYDDIFAFSHHGTDPVSGMTVNAFDLVRVHMFGDVDDDPDVKTESMKLMIEFARGIEEVKVRSVKEGFTRRASAEEDFEGMGDECDVDQGSDPDGWIKRLELSKTGQVEATIENIEIILDNDPEFKGRFGYNELKRANSVISPVARRFSDGDRADVYAHLEKLYKVFNDAKAKIALDRVFARRSFHPIRDYLSALKWDGVPRIESLFVNFLGAEDSPYVRRVTRKMFVGAVARAMTPGVKFDWVLTLIGAEGIGKSTIFSKLGRMWFSNSIPSLRMDQKSFEALEGTWILEIGELSAMNRSEVQEAKDFIASQSDNYRPAYGHYKQENFRQNIFVATTNEFNCLRGINGDRRFWPVVCHPADALFDVGDDLSDDLVGQMWAEAFEIWKTGEQLHLERDFEALARAVQAEHAEVDERLSLVEDYVERLLPVNWEDWNLDQRRTFLSGNDIVVGTEVRMTVSVHEVWSECFGKKPEDCDPRSSKPVNAILKKLKGFETTKHVQRNKLYGRIHYFRRIV